MEELKDRRKSPSKSRPPTPGNRTAADRKETCAADKPARSHLPFGVRSKTRCADHRPNESTSRRKTRRTEQSRPAAKDRRGRPASWRVYAGPFNKSDTRPRIAVVVTHLGLSPQLTQRVITELPGQITLGFAPYARSLGDWIHASPRRRHEVLIGLPMEPSDYPRGNDRGPNGLMLANSPENI